MALWWNNRRISFWFLVFTTGVPWRVTRRWRKFHSAVSTTAQGSEPRRSQACSKPQKEKESKRQRKNTGNLSCKNFDNWLVDVSTLETKICFTSGLRGCFVGCRRLPVPQTCIQNLVTSRAVSRLLCPILTAQQTSLHHPLNLNHRAQVRSSLMSKVQHLCHLVPGFCRSVCIW